MSMFYIYLWSPSDQHNITSAKFLIAVYEGGVTSYIYVMKPNGDDPSRGGFCRKLFTEVLDTLQVNQVKSSDPNITVI